MFYRLLTILKLRSLEESGKRLWVVAIAFLFLLGISWNDEVVPVAVFVILFIGLFLYFSFNLVALIFWLNKTWDLMDTPSRVNYTVGCVFAGLFWVMPFAAFISMLSSI